MSVPFSNTKLRIPKGFQNILEGFTREILREQPADIVQFGDRYFTNLVERRKATGHDPAVHGCNTEDRYYHNWGFDKNPPRCSDAELVKTTSQVEDEDDEAEREKENAAASTIQERIRQDYEIKRAIKKGMPMAKNSVTYAIYF